VHHNHHRHHNGRPIPAAASRGGYRRDSADLDFNFVDPELPDFEELDRPEDEDGRRPMLGMNDAMKPTAAFDDYQSLRSRHNFAAAQSSSRKQQPVQQQQRDQRRRLTNALTAPIGYGALQ
jgi:hypothetical protein